jgi:protein TonB
MRHERALSPLGCLLEEIRAGQRTRRSAGAPEAPALSSGRAPELHIEAGIVSGARSREHARQSWRWPAAVAAHAAALAAVTLIPLMSPSELPEPAMGARVFVVPGLVAPPPPPAPPTATVARTSPARKEPRATRSLATPTAPETAAVEPPSILERAIPAPAIPVQTADEGVPGGLEEGVPGGIVGGILEPSARADESSPPTGRVRVGGAVKEPRKLKNIAPVYPDVAARAKVEGVVLLELAIAPSGRVEDVRVLRSIPLLDEAAVAAARQWLFTPTLLGGVPVHVAMTVSVRFNLTQAASF